MDIAAYQSVGPSLLSYPNPFKFFILFLGCVTVRLTALQFISLSVTLVNHYPHVFGDPFPNTRQATKVAR